MSCLLRYFDTEHGRGEYEKYLNFESNFTSDGLIADSKMAVYLLEGLMVSSRLVIYFDLWQTSSLFIFSFTWEFFISRYVWWIYTSTYFYTLPQ